MLDLAELLDRGVPPIAGGALDQTAWFLAAARQVLGDKRTAEAEMFGPLAALLR